MDYSKIQVKKMNDHIYLLDDAGASTGYLVIGSEKALVIDTMNGDADVAACCRQFTELPFMVVNTHGHPDHIHGNVFFDEAYVHPDDWYVVQDAVMHPQFVTMCKENGLSMPPFKDILPGEVIDLGGLHVEVIGCPGHTPGGILLLLKEDRILFTGDSINRHTWLQLPHNTSLEIFRDTLRGLTYLKNEADRILHGHAQDFDDISLIDTLLLTVEDALSGNTEGETDYKWFDGVDLYHPFPNAPTEGGICIKPSYASITKARHDWAIGDAKRDEGLTQPEDVTAYRDISYGLFGEDSLLDVYVPTAKEKFLPGAVKEDKPGKLPVLVNIHGGGFFYGNKEVYQYYCMGMAQYGFVVVNFNYRRCPEYRFPNTLQDTNEVLCWIKAHAEEYGMDTDRLFLMGDSAGAQLASHYGAINTNAAFAALYAMRTHGLKVKGVALACGLYDLADFYRHPEHEEVQAYIGRGHNTEDPRLDVLAAIKENFPPTFIFTAPNDFLHDACKPMADLLRKKGVRVEEQDYGTKEMTEISHVFHVNMRLPLSEKTRCDQATFLLSIE